MVRRDNGMKVDVPVTNLVEEVTALLDRIQESLLKTARQKRDACIEVIKTWNEFMAALNNKKLIFAPWCDEEVHDLFFI
jgi:prolyl-tRNA synthetase